VKLPKYLRNKYIVSLSIFVAYTLFLDDIDIFTIIHQNRKLHALKAQQKQTDIQLQQTKLILDELNTIDGLERYAREKKFFKKDDEDIFVITYE